MLKCKKGHNFRVALMLKGSQFLNKVRFCGSTLVVCVTYVFNVGTCVNFSPFLTRSGTAAASPWNQLYLDEEKIKKFDKLENCEFYKFFQPFSMTLGFYRFLVFIFMPLMVRQLGPRGHLRRVFSQRVLGHATLSLSK